MPRRLTGAPSADSENFTCSDFHSQLQRGMPDDHALRTWRKDKGVTLAALAVRVGVTPSHLSEIENWKNEPSLELAAKLSRETVDDTGAPVVPLDAFVQQGAAA